MPTHTPLITVRILEGLERGRVFQDLQAPVSIGREEDNDIQLNDDRVSRFHAKLQVDGDRVILTDLDSTNGTRVNGHPVQVRVLQQGDLVSVGRCLLLVGDPEPVPGPADSAGPPDRTALLQPSDHATAEGDWDFLSPPAGLIPTDQPLFPRGAPPCPDGLRPLHRAQLSDVLSFLHSELGAVLNSAVEEPAPGDQRCIRAPWAEWQRLLTVQAALANYLLHVADPDRS
jgi:predicted component of type VI protein secretion system